MSSLKLTNGPYGLRILERFKQLRPQSMAEAKSSPEFKNQLHRAETYFPARKAYHAQAFDEISPPTSANEVELHRNQLREEYIEDKISKEIDNWVRNFPNTGYAST